MTPNNLAQIIWRDWELNPGLESYFINFRVIQLFINLLNAYILVECGLCRLPTHMFADRPQDNVLGRPVMLLYAGLYSVCDELSGMHRSAGWQV